MNVGLFKSKMQFEDREPNFDHSDQKRDIPFSKLEHEDFSYKDGPFLIDEKEDRKPSKPKIFIRGKNGGRVQLHRKTFEKGVLVDV